MLRFVVVLMVWYDPNPIPQVTVGTQSHRTLRACNDQAIDVIKRKRLGLRDMASVRCHERWIHPS